MKARLSVPLEHEPSFARLLAYRHNRDETFLSFRWVQCFTPLLVRRRDVREGRGPVAERLPRCRSGPLDH